MPKSSWLDSSPASTARDRRTGLSLDCARNKMAEGKEGLLSAPDLQCWKVLEQGLKPGIKMERTELVDPKSEMGSKGPRKPLHATVQVGSVGQEGLQQVWEAQWQAFLKTMESPHSGTGSLHLPEMISWGDPKAYLVPYEEVTAAGQKAMEQYLSSCNGVSHQTHIEHNLREKRSNGKVKEETEEALSMERHRQGFRQFCYHEAENPQEACRRLWELCHRWLEPDKRTKEEILDLLILEQFLAVLPDEIQSRVKEQAPGTCAQAVALVEDFLPAQWKAEKWETQDTGLFQKVVVKVPEDEVRDTHRQFWNVEIQECGGDAGLAGKEPVRQREEQESSEQDHHGTLEARDTVNECKQAGSSEGLCGSQKQQGSAQRQRMDQSIPLRGVYQEPSGTTNKEGQVTLTEYGQSSSLMTNERIPTEEKPFQCSECGKSFRRKDKLVQHQKTHSGERPYECLDCGKSFSSKYGLIRHYGIHRGEKPYECLYCGKFFRMNYDLIRHNRIHTGEKPFECSHCGKSFGMNSDLVRHQRIHMAEKPFKCPDCSKGFNIKGRLMAHIRNHKELKRYRCGECGK